MGKYSFKVGASSETFKRNVWHQVKEKEDLDFIIETRQTDEIGKYRKLQWYPEAYYLPAAIDYLCRVNDLPICTLFQIIDWFSLTRVFEFPCLSIECSFWHSAGLSSLPGYYFLVSPCLKNLIKVLRQRVLRHAELHSLDLCRRYTFLLAFLDVLTF